MKNFILALVLTIFSDASKIPAKSINLNTFAPYEIMELKKLENKTITKENTKEKQNRHTLKRKTKNIVISRKESRKADSKLDSSTISPYIEDKLFFNKNHWIASPKGVNFQLIEALNTYQGPSLTITSGHRNWGARDHKDGIAVDISYSEDIVQYFMTDGQDWLDNYNLEFFIEDRHEATSSKIPESFRHHWRLISWATGLHIHINLKCSKNFKS